MARRTGGLLVKQDLNALDTRKVSPFDHVSAEHPVERVVRAGENAGGTRRQTNLFILFTSGCKG